MQVEKRVYTHRVRVQVRDKGSIRQWQNVPCLVLLEWAPEVGVEGGFEIAKTCLAGPGARLQGGRMQIAVVSVGFSSGLNSWKKFPQTFAQ